MGKHAPFMRQSLNQRFILIMITITIQKRLFSIKGEGMCEKIFSVKMNKLTQVLIPVALLSSVVFGLPLAEDNIFEGLAINLPSNEFHFKLTDSDRIFGGQEAAVGQFPHQISLRVVYKERTIHICGGSIITNRFVITAGHCYVFESFPDPSSYRILAGGHEPGVENGTLYEVNRWIVHEDYYANLTETNATIRNDIALIETAETIEFNDLVAPIALHRKFFEGEVEAVSSGWGRNNVSLILLETETNSLIQNSSNSVINSNYFIFAVDRIWFRI